MTDTALHAVLSGADTSVRPQDDLFRAVNGTWLREKEIPADQVSVGSFIDLRDEAELHVRELIEKAADAAGTAGSETAAGDKAAAADAAPGVPAESLAKVVALYRSFIDTAAINEKGTAPLTADLDPVAQAETKEDLARVIGALMRTGWIVSSGWMWPPAWSIPMSMSSPSASPAWVCPMKPITAKRNSLRS